MLQGSCSPYKCCTRSCHRCTALQDRSCTPRSRCSQTSHSSRIRRDLLHRSCKHRGACSCLKGPYLHKAQTHSFQGCKSLRLGRSCTRRAKCNLPPKVLGMCHCRLWLVGCSSALQGRYNLESQTGRTRHLHRHRRCSCRRSPRTGRQGRRTS